MGELTAEQMQILKTADARGLPIIVPELEGGLVNTIYPEDVTTGQILDILRTYFPSAELAEEATESPVLQRKAAIFKVTLPPTVKLFHPDIGVKIRNLSALTDEATAPLVSILYASDVGQVATEGFLETPTGKKWLQDHPPSMSYAWVVVGLGALALLFLFKGRE